MFKGATFNDVTSKKVIDAPDGRRFNRPTDNMPAVRLCNICGFMLPMSGPEYDVRVHVWCIQERKLLDRKRIGRPTYGSSNPTGSF